MKKLFAILFSLFLLLPLHAQDNDEPYWIMEPQEEVNSLTAEINSRSSQLFLYSQGVDELSWVVNQPKKTESESETTKTPFSFPRQIFEFGIDAGAGLDNNIFNVGEVIKTVTAFDLNQIVNNISEGDVNLNLAAVAGFYFISKNITIRQSIWDFGIFAGADGNIKLNVPKFLIDFIAGNDVDYESLEGTISASGGFYAQAGLSASTTFGKLRISARPALFAPLVFIQKSGSEINFSISKDEPIAISTSGAISIYGPFFGNRELKFGADLSLDGEYALFPFLDAGGSFSNIPIFPAIIENRIRYSIDENSELPEINFIDADDAFKLSVMRPMRFDLYARYKPFSNELLVIKPNVGFSVDFNNKQSFFNAGAEARLNLKDLFFASLCINHTESIWIYKLGLALNLRAFEIDLQAAIRSETFTGSFKAQGAGINLGLRFGW